MDREILFKAKRKDNGEWVEGYYLNIAKINPFICTGKIKLDGALKGIIAPEMHEIVPDTVCQYTGLTDRDGKKIWENDIVRNKAKWGAWLGKVIFKNSCFVIEWCEYREHSKKGMSAFSENLINAKEVVGNVFDNPELSEVE